APGLRKEPGGPIADEHAAIPEGARTEQAPEIELPLAPGKPQGAGHAVQVLTDGGEVAALTDVIREKRQHTLRQCWRRREQVVERGNGAQSIEVPGQDLRSEEHTSELQSLTNLVCRLLLDK